MVIVRTTEFKQKMLSSKMGGCTPTTAIKRNYRTWRPTWISNVYVRCSGNKVSRSIELVVLLISLVRLSLAPNFPSPRFVVKSRRLS